MSAIGCDYMTSRHAYCASRAVSFYVLDRGRLKPFAARCSQHLIQQYTVGPDVKEVTNEEYVVLRIMES